VVAGCCTFPDPSVADCCRQRVPTGGAAQPAAARTSARAGTGRLCITVQQVSMISAVEQPGAPQCAAGTQSFKCL